jgi:hypothetical protein
VQGALVYLGLFLLAAILLQAFTRWAALDWLGQIPRKAVGA